MDEETEKRLDDILLLAFLECQSDSEEELGPTESEHTSEARPIGTTPESQLEPQTSRPSISPRQQKEPTARVSAMAGFGNQSVFGAPSQAFGAPQFGLVPPAFGAPPPMPTSRQSSTTFNMMGSNVLGSGGASAATASSTVPFNPFANASSAPSTNAPNPFASAPSVLNNPFASATPPASSNPFANAINTTTQPSNLAPNSFASNGPAKPSPPPASQTAPQTNPFAHLADKSNNQPAAPFARITDNAQKRKNGFGEKNDFKRPSPGISSTMFQKAQNTSTDSTAVGFGKAPAKKHTNGFADYLKGKSNVPKALPKPPVKQAPKVTSNYAKAIHDQLRKDNVKAPAWPADPGNPANRKAMDDFKEKYKKYDARVRSSLIKAGLIDDPEVRKALSEAIDFRGICEDMCPEHEKVSRIVENDVKLAEKTPGPDGLAPWASPDRMVKTFKRSAAGMDSPLPTDVRSPAALRRTVDYLIDDLLQSDGNLPTQHNFLWDRTRAIRKDFIFQNAMSPNERMDQIYCLETIARFHAVALHLLSQEGFAAEDFSEQQEQEQLGKTLLSLIQVYDECKDLDVKSENEAEFRAYFLLFNAHDTFSMQQLQDWDEKFYFKSEDIQTVILLAQAMQNIWRGRGPMKPEAPLTMGSPSFTSFFSIVESPRVSYTMACFAEIHFVEIRKHLLKTINKGYGRPRGPSPKDLTAEAVNQILRFDTTDQCVKFVEDLGMEFSSEDSTEPYLVVHRRAEIPYKTIRQSFSRDLVERKRGDRSLPEVIHNTVFEEVSNDNALDEDSDSMFVEQPSQTAMVSIESSSQPEPVLENENPLPTVALAPPSNPLTTSGPFQTSIFLNPLVPPPETQPVNNVPVPTPQKSLFPPSFGNPHPAPAAENASSASPAPNSSLPSKETAKWTFPSIPAFTGADAAPQTTGSVFDSLSKPAQSSSTAFFQAAPEPPTVKSPTKEAAPLFPGTTSTTGQAKAPETTSEPPSLSSSAMKMPAGWPAPSFGSTNNQPPSLSSSTMKMPAGWPAPSFGSTNSQTPSQPTSLPQVPTTLPTAQQPKTSSELQQHQQVPPSAIPATSLFKPVQPPPVPIKKPRKDPMGDFTKWLVLGDTGLLDQFQEVMVENLVMGAFTKFKEDEEERKRQEEDAESWRIALKWRDWNLRVKFFYRWQKIARKLAMRRVAREGKAAAKAYREAKAAEAKAAKAKAAKDEKARLKRLNTPSTYLHDLEKERAVKRTKRDSMSRQTSRRNSVASSAEDALFATGILSGINNERQAVARCVDDDNDSLYDALVGGSVPRNDARQTMGPPARPKDPLRSVRSGGVSKPFVKPKPVVKPKPESAKMQYLRDLVSGKSKSNDLLSLSSRSSSRFSQSLPAAAKFTNFTKYQSSSPRSSVDLDPAQPKRRSGIKSNYWLLKSRGLTAMPNGQVLPDSLARYTGTGVYDKGSGSQASEESGDLEEFDERILEDGADGAYRATLGLTGHRSSFGSLREAVARQSLQDTAADRLGKHRDSHAQSARKDSNLPDDVEETLREFREAAAAMDEGTDWFREQNEKLLQGGSPFE